MTGQEIGDAINATNYVEGVSPLWNEMIYVDISEDNSSSEGKVNECVFTVETNRSIILRKKKKTNLLYFYLLKYKLSILYLEFHILIMDEPSGKKISSHNIPWRWFKPFYQYHLNLQQDLPQTGQTVCLYVSIMLKQSALSKENIRYFGLEVLLNGFDAPITNSQSIYSVARIVPDFKSYKYVLCFIEKYI